ncbi:type I-F CRISPR-associated protein Csy3 [Desulfonatronovibrio hydrogenovorans]|uniref:type I-F CRISPR-associated protein Csy3 n=1 Tax=Desulfonatronovibrio hydrogenovorans TaxID=53245 RepID=UPI00048F0F16|nr:type I-F CRISPR-associated protein Csy3 [Desulfonatronovibrio hydrogenovorans]
MAKNENKASVLAFDRRLSSSNALFFGVKWDERKNGIGRPLPIQEKSVRGVIDNRLKDKDQNQTKVEASIENPNLQTVDYCALGMDEDTLRVRFNIQVAGKVEPCACNNPAVKKKIEGIVSEFAKNDRFMELARRYAVNLANGRFLWRNRLGAEQIEITIKADGKDYVFLNIPLTKFGELEDEVGKKTNELGKKMADVLSGQNSHINLEIDACVKRFPGMEVYPSQELVLDNSRGKGKKSKHLFQANYKYQGKDFQAAALHPQKVTNAIHTIDDWYHPEADKPISINSYGAVTNEGKAYREPKNNDFYTLFDKAVQQGLSELDINDQKYMMAMLVRGGVFGEGGD